MNGEERRPAAVWPWLSPTLMGAAYVLYFGLSGRYIIFSDTCPIYRRAIELVLDGKWPLVGNMIFGDFRLGPLTDLLVAACLLLTGNLASPHWLVSLLWVLSMPVFYAAVKDYLPDPLAAGAATAWFGLSPFNFVLLVTPWNTSFLPFFLAVFTWTLFRAWKGLHLAWMYAVIGLCMHLHFTSVLLIPAAWAFLALHRRPVWRCWWGHALGLLTVAALHASVVFYYFQNIDPLAKPAAGLRNLPQIDVPRLLVIGVMYLLLNYPLSLAWLCRLCGPRASLPEIRAKEIRLGLVMLLPILASSQIGAAFGNVQTRYFYAAWPFLSLLVGIEVWRVLRTLPRHWGQAFVAVVALVTAGMTVAVTELTRVEHDGQTVAEHERLAADVYGWMKATGWTGATRFDTLRFSCVNGETFWMNPQQPGCLETILRFQKRESFTPSAVEPVKWIAVAFPQEGLWERWAFNFPHPPPRRSNLPRDCRLLTRAERQAVYLCNQWSADEIESVACDPAKPWFPAVDDPPLPQPD